MPYEKKHDRQYLTNDHEYLIRFFMAKIFFAAFSEI